jgi:hypothetical protein
MSSVAPFPRQEAFLDRWFVTNGVVAAGPVSYEVLVQGVAAGRIPRGSFIRHESWNVWRKIDDMNGLSGRRLQDTVQKLAELSSALEDRASGPYSEPPPPPSREEVARFPRAANDPSEGPLRPVAVDPVGVLAQAEDLSRALSFTLSTAVAAASADVGLLHHIRPALGTMVTLYAQGPNAEQLLGEKLAAHDPTVAAARSGSTVMAEPGLGEVGRYLAGRIGRCVAQPRGLAMVPLRLHGVMHVMVELGRRQTAFRAREIARVEDVVSALIERAVVMGWFESDDDSALALD